MRKENSTIRTKFISEAGSQLINADYFAFVELDNYACYCVADGIDNDKLKESAKIAVTTVIDEFLQKPGMSKGLMKKYLDKAHRTLLKESGTFRLESSLLVVITDYRKMRYANAGNVRMYQWRNGKIINQSKDQSLSQDMAEKGELALDKIEEHEERHNLYCYAGQRGKFRPFVSKKIKLQDGDIISMMTCGIWENTGMAELLDSIEDAKAPEDVCTSMEEIILSQRLRNIQNYTFACVYVDKVYLNPNKQRNQKLIKKIVIPIAIALFMLLVVFITSKVIMYRNINSMWNNIELAVQDMAAGLDEEGNSNYEKALEMYEEFDSKSELSNKRVIQAKYYLNMLKFREDYNKGENCYDRYVAACKIMICLVGRNGYERVENDGLDDKVLSISTLQMIEYNYIDNATKADLENFTEAFTEEFELVKEEYRIYRLLVQAQELFEKEINDANNERDLISNAQDYGIVIYNYEGTEFADVYAELKESIANAISNNINLGNTKEEYDSFLIKVSSKLSYIKGKAYADKGDKAALDSDYSEAKIAYENARDSMKKAGADIYAGEISDLENKLKEVEGKAIDEINAEARELLNQAGEKFAAKRYSEAEALCKQVAEKLTETGVTSGIVYDDLNKLSKCVEMAKKALNYEREAGTYEAQGNYSLAYETYKLAQEAYSEAGVTDKERLMRQKMSALSALINQ